LVYNGTLPPAEGLSICIGLEKILAQLGPYGFQPEAQISDQWVVPEDGVLFLPYVMDRHE
jgi:hypothetical protein